MPLGGPVAVTSAPSPVWIFHVARSLAAENQLGFPRRLLAETMNPDQLAVAFFPRKCVESSGASARATAVSRTASLLRRGPCARQAASRKG